MNKEEIEEEIRENLATLKGARKAAQKCDLQVIELAVETNIETVEGILEHFEAATAEKQKPDPLEDPDIPLDHIPVKNAPGFEVRHWEFSMSPGGYMTGEITVQVDGDLLAAMKTNDLGHFFDHLEGEIETRKIGTIRKDEKTELQKLYFYSTGPYEFKDEKKFHEKYMDDPS